MSYHNPHSLGAIVPSSSPTDDVYELQATLNIGAPRVGMAQTPLTGILDQRTKSLAETVMDKWHPSWRTEVPSGGDIWSWPQLGIKVWTRALKMWMGVDPNTVGSELIEISADAPAAHARKSRLVYILGGLGVLGYYAYKKGYLS